MRIVPGVTAMLAVASRAGAPLGHDFCALSLSDNLKPWELIERRLAAAAEAGFVIALYNPVSQARTWQLAHAFTLLGRHLPGTTPVIFGRAVGRAGEGLVVTTLAEAAAIAADMATLIIIGSRETRILARDRTGAARLYAARHFFGPRMIEPRKSLFHRCDGWHAGKRRARQHDDGKPKRARRRDLAVGRVPTAILGDHDLDAMLLEQRAILGLVERSARGDVTRMRYGKRSIDGIDAADEIEMLRARCEGLKLVAAERKEHAARRFAKRARGLLDASTTSIQVSPSTRLQGGRLIASSLTPESPAARAALAEMTSA